MQLLLRPLWGVDTAFQASNRLRCGVEGTQVWGAKAGLHRGTHAQAAGTTIVSATCCLLRIVCLFTVGV